MKRGLLVVVIGLFLAGCANDLYETNPGSLKTIGPNDNQNPPPSQKLNLVLFSAPWCGECKPKLQTTESLLASVLSAADHRRVNVTLYVVEGRRVHSQPTDRVTSDYATALGTRFNVVSDPWYWNTYKAFYHDNQYAVPAAVLLDQKNQPIQIFERGLFLPEEVVALIEDKLK